MGRAEKRRQERLARKQGSAVTAKQQPNVIKRYTEEGFNKLIFDVDYKARVETIQFMMTIFTLADHRVHKHGYTRLHRTLDYVNELMDDINNEKTTFEKLKEQCLDETGINFVL